ncbi:MAG: HNH endonuclease signature motif containing protein [Chloroflexota bacterium]
MSDSLSWVETKRIVHERAIFRCEYCQTPQKATGQSMHVEHIIPNKSNLLDNLCLACPSCNLSKSSATDATDPQTNEIVALFNPRTQNWSEHFQWEDDGQIIAGKTPIGRATIVRLKMNQLRIVEARKIWILAGIHPP